MGKVKAAQADDGRKAASLFADYPKAKTLYFTADGMAWFTEQEAMTHAAALKDNTVQTIKKR